MLSSSSVFGQFTGLETIDAAETLNLSDNDLAEAFDLGLLEPIEGKFPEQLTEAPRILSDQIRVNTNTAILFRDYLNAKDDSIRLNLESQLVELYN